MSLNKDIHLPNIYIDNISIISRVYDFIYYKDINSNLYYKVDITTNLITQLKFLDEISSDINNYILLKYDNETYISINVENGLLKKNNLINNEIDSVTIDYIAEREYKTNFVNCLMINDILYCCNSNYEDEYLELRKIDINNDTTNHGGNGRDFECEFLRDIYLYYYHDNQIYIITNSGVIYKIVDLDLMTEQDLELVNDKKIENIYNTRVFDNKILNLYIENNINYIDIYNIDNFNKETIKIYNVKILDFLFENNNIYLVCENNNNKFISIINTKLNEYTYESFNYKLLYNNLYKDFKIVHPEGIIEIHKEIIFESSKYFEGLLSGKYGEINEVQINEISYEAIQEIIKFIYLGYCNITINNYCDILYYSDKYLLSELFVNCCNLFDKFININNIINLYSKCSHIDKISKIILEFIKTNISDIPKSIIVNIDPLIIKEIFMKI